MPLILAFVGIFMIVLGINGCYAKMFELLKGDFFGQQSFAVWITAIIIIWAFGYVPKMKDISQAFMALVVIVILLKNGQGVLDPTTGFVAQIKEGFS